MVEVDHIGVVNSEKFFKGQLTFVFPQWFGGDQRSGLVVQMKFGIASGWFEIEDIKPFDQTDLIDTGNGDKITLIALIALTMGFFEFVDLPMIDEFLFFNFDEYPFYGFDKRLNLNGFKDVIDGVEFKTLNGELIESRYKNDKGMILYLLKQFEGCFFIEDDVQKK